MVAFGIDPGSTVTGYGVVALDRGRYRLVGAGAIRTSADDPVEQRLLAIHDGLMEAFRTHAVDSVAIEAIFRHKSSESALRLGQARGVALLAVARSGHAAVEYNNSTVKRTVGAHGQADKDAIARMVGLLLGASADGPRDVTDALAIAITHCAHLRNRALVTGVRT